MDIVIRKLILPDDFADYAWEVQAKGFFWLGVVSVGDASFEVTFYEPVRLAQDIAAELESDRLFVAKRLLVVPEVTLQHMTDAVDQAPSDFFS